VEEVSEVAIRAQMAGTWQYVLLLVVFCFGMAGTSEELLKYVPIAYMRRKQSTPSSTLAKARLYVQYAVAAAVGFATIENIGLVYAAIKGGESATKVAITVAERVVFSAPGPSLCAWLLAIRAAGEVSTKPTWRKLWSIIGASALYHGALDFLFFALSAWNGHVGWIHPRDDTSIAVGLVGVIGWQGSLALQVRREWRELHSAENTKTGAKIGKEGSATEMDSTEVEK